MRYLVGLFALLMVFTALSAPIRADEIQYGLNGTFGADTLAAPLSGPNGSYSMSFSLPQNPTPDYVNDGNNFEIDLVPVSYSFLCDGCSTPVTFDDSLLFVDFATTAAGGMFVADLLTPDNEYFWLFSGEQLFTGAVDNPTLVPGGPFDLTGHGIFELDGNEFVELGKTTLTVSAPVATPEPSTFALLCAALASLALMAWIKTQRA